MPVRWTVVGLALGVLAGAGQGRDAQDVLARARALYVAGDYDSSAATIRSFVKDHGKDPAMEQMVPLLMESLTRLGDNKYFKKLFTIYEKKYPDSDFMPRLYYLAGVVSSREKDYSGAVLAFSSALASGVREPLDSLAVRSATLLCDRSLTVEEVGRLASRDDLDPRIAEVVAFYEFMKLDKRGLTGKARERAEGFREKYPGSRYEAFARDVIGHGRGRNRGEVQVGLMAPLSGYDADVGRQIVQSVQLAVDRHNEQGSPLVKLVIADTRGNMVEAARQAREMVDVHKVPVIIGPVLSPNAIVTAAVVMGRGTVMVTPTATDEGIAGLGKNIFQVNITIGMLGRRIARYAMENLNIKEFAIVAPLTEYGQVLAKNFREAVMAAQGVVVAEEYFDEGTTDFGRQLGELRVKLIARKRERVAIANGSVYAPTESRRASDSLLYADSALAVGGLFIPAEAEDVVMLAPQVHFNRIRSQILGANGWHVSSVILDGKRYVNDAVFSTGLQVDPKSEAWMKFASLYKQRFGAEPDRIAAPLGYDAAMLVLKALVAADGGGAARLADELHSMQKHQGVSGTISFDPVVGANTETAIMKIKDRQFVRLE